jgi:hypothetical protein
MGGPRSFMDYKAIGFPVVEDADNPVTGQCEAIKATERSGLSVARKIAAFRWFVILSHSSNGGQ